MSHRGPSLLRDRNGYAFAKFDGKKLNFGRFDDPASHDEFATYKAAWIANGRQAPTPTTTRVRITVEELAVRFLAHLDDRYGPAWHSNNYDRCEQALKPLRAVFGQHPADTFSPKRLKVVREAMVASTREKKVGAAKIQVPRLCRTEINYRVQVIRRAFRWAVSEELVPPDVAHGLAAVDSLREAEHGVREGREVHPVDEATFRATLPFLSRPAAALCELMWWCGARPSEVLALCPGDIDRSGKVWEVQLAEHKNRKRGKRRQIYFGPEAQRVIEPFLLRPADRPLFSPAEAEEERRRQLRDARVTPLWPSHVERYERQRKDAKLADTYTATTLRHAVVRAVAAANTARREENEKKPEKDKLPPLGSWTPYQLRHAAATRVRKEHGLEMVRCLLGHSSAAMSEVYAEVDLEKAKKVMELAG